MASRFANLSGEESSTYVKLNSQTPFPLVALSRLTREGHGRFFHSVPSGPKRCRKGVGQEWPLVKASIIAGVAFPVTVTVGDCHELVAWLIKQGIGFGAAFEGARFGAVGAHGHQVARQG